MKKLNRTCAAFAIAGLMSGGTSALAYQDPVPTTEPQPVPEVAPQPRPDPQTTPDVRPAPEQDIKTSAEVTSAQMATGELVKVDAEKMTFTVKGADEKTWTFSYNDDTEVAGAQDDVAGLATKSGTIVTVHFTGDDAARVATKIKIQAATP